MKIIDAVKAQRLFDKGIAVEVLDGKDWIKCDSFVEPKDFKRAKRFRKAKVS